MGYERNDRRFGRETGYGRSSSQDRDYDRAYGRDRYSSRTPADPYAARDDDRYRDYDRDTRDYGHQPQGYDYDDRGFFERAGDEVRSWFGDEEAERRRQYDERFREREERARGDRPGYGDRYSRTQAGYGASGYGTGLGTGPTEYGAGRGAGATGNWGLGAGRDREEWGYDPNYRSWRDRQIASFDQDYDEYRREHQSKFDTEFHNWRTTRQGQRDTLGQVREHQEVVGSDGEHIGKVDKVRGDRIILTKSDQEAGGHHHSIPCAWISEVAEKVKISKTASEAQAHWRDEERNPAIGGARETDGIRRDHNLNRSFSGTY